MINRSFGVVLFLVSASAFAQSPITAAPQDPIPMRHSALWIETPVAVGAPTVAVRYERELLPKLSISAAVELGGAYSSTTHNDVQGFEMLSRAGSAHVGISHYFGAQALSGLYVHARLGAIGSAWSTDASNVAVGSSTSVRFGPSAAAMLGYGFVTESGLALQLAVGFRGGYEWTGFSVGGASAQSSHGTSLSVGPTTNLSVGWAL